MTAEQAAGVVLFYFIGMAVGRFLSGIAADKLHSWKIIMLGESVLGIAVLLLAIPGPALLSAIGLFMIGLGNGPLFPNFNYLAPESFGKDVSESVISLQMAAAYVEEKKDRPQCDSDFYHWFHENVRFSMLLAHGTAFGGVRISSGDLCRRQKHRPSRQARTAHGAALRGSRCPDKSLYAKVGK